MPTTGIIRCNKIGYGICAQCGKEFKREKKNSGRGYKERKFCSIECENKYHRKVSEQNYGYKICVVCGKQFKRQRTKDYYSDSMFCSEECKNKYADEKHPGRIKYCKFCEKRIEPSFYGKTGQYYLSSFCNKDCENKYNAEVYGKIECKMCGKLFYREHFIALSGKKEYKRGYIYQYCEDCRKNLPAGHSQNEKEFALLLQKENISVDQKEYRLENSYYDFHVTNFNILIDINPSYTHCIEQTYFNSGKDINYHFDRVNLANKYGFFYICVWDWSNINYIINIIKRLMQNSSTTKYAIKEHKQPNKIINKKDTDICVKEQEKLENETYLTVYDCGDYCYCKYEDIKLN